LKTNTFLSNFPGNNPWPQQIEALQKAEHYFNAGKKYVILRLPTGSGKSHIATSIARSSDDINPELSTLLNTYEAFKKDNSGNWMHSSKFEASSPFGAAILTVTRSLQNQYTELFPEQIAAKGKNNYNCDIDKNVTVDFAPCLFTPGLKQECFDANRCPYFKSRKDALISKDPVLNYKAFFNLPNFLQKRQYLIFDEADKLESELVGQYSIVINYSQLAAEEIPFTKLTSDSSAEAGLWLSELFLHIKESLTELKHKVSLMVGKNYKSNGILFKQMQRLGKLNNLYNSMMDVVMNWVDCQYLVENRTAKEVTLVPYDIKPLAKQLFDRGKRILLMSATISNPEQYAKSLGIKDKEYTFIDVKSTFDAEKSPIYCSTMYSLSHKNLESSLPKIINIIKEICDKHKGEKGLIHTHTNSITESIKKVLGRNNRFLFREVGISNEDIVLEHKTRTKDDTVLVSPSLDTGVSLDDDLGRFQIIVKAPFLPLGSKRIKKMFDKNPNYYSMKMLDTLIQMCGRCTRSKKDYSVTYILDGTIVKAIVNNKNNLPKYFLDRFM
jgi:ATP-dependent DNA helicase DinG